MTQGVDLQDRNKFASVGRKIHTASAIEQPVSSLDGIVDSVGAGCVVNFP